MFKKISAVLIWSEDYKKLAQWYQDILDLEIVEELNHPNDTGILFEIGGVYLWVGKHDKVKGKSKDFHRIMINIRVDSVRKAYEHLKSKKVKFLARPFKAPTSETYFATSYDLDDNILQIIGSK